MENLDYVIENKLHDNINCIVGHEKLLNALYEWMKYKDARKPKTNNHYASIQAFKSLITKLVTAMNEYGEDELVECINNSMANNYSGIIFNMLGKNQQGKKPKFDAEAWASQ